MNKNEITIRQKLVDQFNKQFKTGDTIEFKEGHFDKSNNKVEWKEWKKYTLKKPAFMGKVSNIPLLTFKESRLIYVLTNQSVKNFNI